MWARRRAAATSLAIAFLPVVGWIVLFASGVALIPPSLRPHINTTLLPRLDALCFNSRFWFTPPEPSNWDLLAAVPYTIHPIIPLLYVALAYRATSTPRFYTFIFTIGIMNLLAVLTHLTFPTAPPWYFIKYGTAAADYTMKGDPAILSRVDERLNILFFTRMYRDGGKVVFGTWPSLHAAWPYLIAVFRPRPDARPVRFVLYFYVAWVWWAAIYLQHHYFVDILGGVFYAELAMILVRAKGGDAEAADVVEGRGGGLLPVSTQDAFSDD